MSKTIYLTTPLYYVNAAPHIGHSYTTIAADCLARYMRLCGHNVFLLTGTDEHGQKIAQAAAASGKGPQEFVDGAVEQFSALWKTLGIVTDDFIRTTQSRHVTAVQAILIKLHDEGKLKRATYQGWYCTPDETFWGESELDPSAAKKGGALCPACGRALEPVEEEGWHLPLLSSQAWLRDLVDKNPKFVQPESRRNELLGLLKQPLPESLCITRPRKRVGWGIPVPFSPEHVTYVWFDALLNYITAPGYIGNPSRFAGLWPADVQFIGKDILRHHALYWPIMLHALGFSDEEMPQMVFAHGWWKIGKQKMSKSIGNIVDPNVVIGQLLKTQPYAADIYRYFLLREVPFGQDGDFSEKALFTRLNADLGNDLGNLVHRTLSMLKRYTDGKIPSIGPVGCALDDEPLRQAACNLPKDLDEAMKELSFSTALEAIMQLVSQANRYIEQQSPWKLAKESDRSRLQMVLALLAEVLRVVAIALEPFMPSISLSIWNQLGCGDRARQMQDISKWPGIEAGQKIGEPTVLFPKTEPK